jgi:glyoxylase-like metal-dependent hydrolase (beta-lactamase superfamily II)
MSSPSGVYSITPRAGATARGGHVHAYLFQEGRELTLVDTLWDADAYLVLQCIAGLGLTPKDLKHIALTHAHRSHLGGLATLKRLSGATVWAHEAEAPIIAGDRSAAPVSLTPVMPLQLLPFRVLARLGIPKHDPCPVDEPIGDVDDRMVGPLQIVHSPGHTPGHLAFYHPEKKVLVAGDAIATWPRFAAGWPGFNQDDDLYLDSLERLVRMRPEYAGTGHGPPLDDNEATPRALMSLVSRRALTKA